jgi:hypothetical protein
MKDNTSEFLNRLYKKDCPVIRETPGRRVISPGLHGGGRPKKFAGAVTGADPLSAAVSDFSGAVDLGRDLPSPSDLALREESNAEVERRGKKWPPQEDGRRFRRNAGGVSDGLRKTS